MEIRAAGAAVRSIYAEAIGACRRGRERFILKPMHARTRRQREVLEIITRYVGNQGYNPSYQQIAKHLGLKSRSGIARIIAELESQGLLERKRDNGHFAISTQGDEKPVLIPWLESPGSEAFDPAAAHPIALPTFMIGACNGDALRALRMPDSTMSPLIEADDIVLVEIREFTREGQIVVAVVDEKETLVRRYYRAGSNIELVDAGERIMSASAETVDILGMFRGLLRPAA
jgi:repressor LexA